MPLWILNLIGFFGKRSLHFVLYALMGLIVFGVYQKLFEPKNSTNVASGGKVVNVYSSDSNRTPILGCATWRLRNETYFQKER